ncbi:hypothetical protein HGRIS_014523 [Hohenbuehelia grisea]|uniref:Uncharacterized protein n=1 Tax=Hohenbuehelia grisea TaxID=104357 RepID=A0ABR3JVZ0_9AGAR
MRLQLAALVLAAAGGALAVGDQTCTCDGVVFPAQTDVQSAILGTKSGKYPEKIQNREV